MTLKQRIKQLIKRMLRLNTFDEYVNIGYNWADSFKDLALRENLPQMIKELKYSLDSQSQRIVDMVLERLICLIPRVHQKVLIHKDTLFSKEELSLQREILSKRIYKSYAFPYHYFGTETYYFHNGIKFLDKNTIRKYITNNIILDLGAYNGDSAYVFSLYKPYKILCFESNKDNFLALKSHIKQFHLNRVIAINKAISNHTSKYNIDRIFKQMAKSKWGGDLINVDLSKWILKVAS